MISTLFFLGGDIEQYDNYMVVRLFSKAYLEFPPCAAVHKGKTIGMVTIENGHGNS